MNNFWGKLLRFQKDKNPSKQVKVSNDFESVLKLSVVHSYYSSICQGIPGRRLYRKKILFYTNYSPPPPAHRTLITIGAADASP